VFSIAYYDIDDGLEHAFYAMEAVVTAVVMTNMFQFGLWRCSQRKGDLTHWQRWEGAYYLGAALPLSLAFPFAVVIIYVGQAGYPDSRMWYGGSWFPNAPHGVVLYLMKWFGTVVLTIGVFKVTELHKKIMKKWRVLRPQQTPVTSVA